MRLIIPVAALIGAIALTQWLGNAGFSQDALAVVWVTCGMIVAIDVIGWTRLHSFAIQQRVLAAVIALAIVIGLSILGWRAYDSYPITSPTIDPTLPRLVFHLPSKDLLPSTIEIHNGTEQIRHVNLEITIDKAETTKSSTISNYRLVSKGRWEFIKNKAIIDVEFGHPFTFLDQQLKNGTATAYIEFSEVGVPARRFVRYIFRLRFDRYGSPRWDLEKTENGRL